MYTLPTSYTVGHYTNHLQKYILKYIRLPFLVLTICLNEEIEKKNTIQQHQFNFVPISLEIMTYISSEGYSESFDCM